MRLDEDSADAGERTLPGVKPPMQSELRFDSAPSTCSVQGARIESRRWTTS